MIFGALIDCRGQLSLTTGSGDALPREALPGVIVDGKCVRHALVRLFS